MKTLCLNKAEKEFESCLMLKLLQFKMLIILQAFSKLAIIGPLIPKSPQGLDDTYNRANFWNYYFYSWPQAFFQGKVLRALKMIPVLSSLN